MYSYLFGSLEKNRRRLSISEYTISQPSLLTALSNILATRLLRQPYRKEIKSRKVLDYIQVLPIDPNTEDTRNSSDHVQELSDNIEMKAIGVGEEISFVVQTDDISSITSQSLDEEESEKR